MEALPREDLIHGEGRERDEGRLHRRRPSSPEAGWRPLDAALAAYVRGAEDEVVEMRTDLGGSEEIPVVLFFRDPAEGGAVERRALEECRGRVLDVGAGVGAFSVPLQQRGLEVTSLEVLSSACEVLERRGLRDVRRGDLEVLDELERFDTVLAMMNGLGLAGSLPGLERFLAALGRRLTADGQILADSTDPSGWGDAGDGRYGGEVHMQLVHRGSPGEPFPYLFVDPETLRRAATRAGLKVEVLVAEQDGRYLARIGPQGS